MEIVAIEIERHDGNALCGILEFRHEQRLEVLLWTIEWGHEPEIMVEFFPYNALDNIELIRAHQQLLIDSLLDTLLQRVGKETLFT